MDFCVARLLMNSTGNGCFNNNGLFYCATGYRVQPCHYCRVMLNHKQIACIPDTCFLRGGIFYLPDSVSSTQAGTSVPAFPSRPSWKALAPGERACSRQMLIRFDDNIMGESDRVETF